MKTTDFLVLRIYRKCDCIDMREDIDSILFSVNTRMFLYFRKLFIKYNR